VVTRGGKGVLAVTAHLGLDRPAIPIDLVDTVGAGDSFTAGLPDGLGRADLLGGARRDALASIDESTPEHRPKEACLVSAITCSRPDADPPAWVEVEATRAARPSTQQVISR
jgi:fructokinase